MEPMDGDPHFRYPHGPRGGPVTDYFIRDWLHENNPPPFNHNERTMVRARVRPPAEPNRALVKRRMHPIAQSVKRPRR